jgi:hypothetical protein
MSRRSSSGNASASAGSCRINSQMGDRVEILLRDRTIQLRDRTDPNGRILRYTPEEFRSFVFRVRSGEFDEICGVGNGGHELGPREGIAPSSQFDADDRLSIRVQINPEWCRRQIAFENHRDMLKARQLWRHLICYCGLMSLSAIIAVLLKAERFPIADAINFGIAVFISSASGTGLAALVGWRERRSTQATRDAISFNHDLAVRARAAERRGAT